MTLPLFTIVNIVCIGWLLALHAYKLHDWAEQFTDFLIPFYSRMVVMEVLM